jgi:hypothetical protein
MFNVKTSAIAGGIGFVVSFLLGLLSGASLPALVVRPLIFAVLFSVIAGVVYFLVTHFLPELLENGEYEAMSPEDALNSGSRINITEEEPAGLASYAAQPDDSEDNLGDIGDLSARSGTAKPIKADLSGLDQHGEDGYTRSETVPSGDRDNGGFTGSAVPRHDMAPAAAESVDVLPDLDSMARAFLPNDGEDEADAAEYSTSDAPLKRPAAGARGQKMEGDFNPKELAAGIRTILKKEG